MVNTGITITPFVSLISFRSLNQVNRFYSTALTQIKGRSTALIWRGNNAVETHELQSTISRNAIVAKSYIPAAISGPDLKGP